MPFSRERIINYALEIKLRRAKIMTGGKGGVPHPDFFLGHKKWVTDAQVGNFTEMNAFIKAKTLKFQADAMNRRNKLAGRKK